MKRLGGRFVRSVGAVIGEPAGKTPASRTESWQVLLDSGLFDQEFYRALIPKKLKPGAPTAKHYVRFGAQFLRPFHPLIQPQNVPRTIRGYWRVGEFEKVFEYLTSSVGLSRPWSTLFDPQVYLENLAISAGLSPEDASESESDEGDVAADLADSAGDSASAKIDLTPVPQGTQVLDYVRTLSPSAVLPVEHRLGEISAITWGEARTHLLKVANRLGEQHRLTRPRSTLRWDRDAEHEWLQSLAHVRVGAYEDPLISIVMPAWNRAHTITGAVESIQQQGFSAWELLVIDDGSTDDTVQVVKMLAKSDPRIVVIEAEHAGVSAARNIGVARARGKYLAFLDSDNTWRPIFLETMAKAMLSRGIAVAYAASQLDAGGDAPATYRAYEGGLADLLVMNHIDLNVLVVETDIARRSGGFDTTLRRWVDHDFAIKVARISEPVFFPFIGCEYSDIAVSDRITTSESEHWQYKVLGHAHVDWLQLEQELPQRIVDRVSILMPIYHDDAMTIDAVLALRRTRGNVDLEIVLVDNGSSPRYSLSLEAAFMAFPEVKLVRLPRNLNFAIGSNLAFARSTGETVVFLNNDTTVWDGWIEPLRARLADPTVRGVQPLLLYPDGTIQAAGTTFPVANGLPIHLLAGFSRDDAHRVRNLEFSVVTAAALMMRAADVVALHGFDPLYVNGMEDVDLCLRAVDAFSGHFVVETSSVVTHHESKSPGRMLKIPENRRIFLERWSGRLPGPEGEHLVAAGLEIAHVGIDHEEYAAPRPIFVRSASAPNAAGIPRLRWSIKSPAVGNYKGEQWGDTHFIEALARELRALDQDVVTYRHGAHAVPATAYDDISLVIRGLDRAYPHPTKTNVLWVISHPEDVSVAEVQAFDLVFAASHAWARRMSERSGREVRVLLQATDAAVFHPRRATESVSESALFVGQARRDFPRRIVMDAIAAGVDVDVWGPGWHRYLTDDHVRGTYFPNDKLGEAYRTAGFVLNDHWHDMAAEGFISNRVFDAVASGARVVSDEVEGIAELFGGAVQIYRDPADLARLCAPGPDNHEFPSSAEMADIAARMAAEHTFAARAQQLMDAVTEYRR